MHPREWVIWNPLQAVDILTITAKYNKIKNNSFIINFG